MVPVPSAVVDGESPHEPARLTDDDPLAGLGPWLAEGRVDAAAAARARRVRLERQASEDSSVAGVCLDLAERGAPVAVRTTAGRTTRGDVVALGIDFVVIRDGPVGDVVVPLRSVATIRGAPGATPVAGVRSVAFTLSVAGALTELAADRPLVLVAIGDQELRGELRSVGLDVVALATAATNREIVHIALDAIDQLVLLRG